MGLQCAAKDSELCDPEEMDNAPKTLFVVKEGSDVRTAIADVAGSNVLGAVRDRAAHEGVPGILGDALRKAHFQWEAEEEDDSPPSPFRAQNFDLMQRCVTREAAI